MLVKIICLEQAGLDENARIRKKHFPSSFISCKMQWEKRLSEELYLDCIEKCISENVAVFTAHLTQYGEQMLPIQHFISSTIFWHSE